MLGQDTFLVIAKLHLAAALAGLRIALFLFDPASQPATHPLTYANCASTREYNSRSQHNLASLLLASMYLAQAELGTAQLQLVHPLSHIPFPFVFETIVKVFELCASL